MKDEKMNGFEPLAWLIAKNQQAFGGVG